MATIRNDRISTPLKYIEIGQNDKLSLGALERGEYPDGTDKEHCNISLTEGCFITKKPGFTLENLYWVKPVQNNPRLQQTVVNYLHDLSLVRIDFSLNEASNISRLDRSLHYALDELGLFAVTNGEQELERQKWPIPEFEKPPFTNAKYELVLLHPHHFLPGRGNTLTVFTEIGNDLSGKMYYVSPDGALREGPDNASPRLPPFTSNDRGGAEKDMLDPFLVVLNAEVAFRRFRERPQPLCKDYNHLIDLTIDLMEKIYFEPVIEEERQHNARLCQTVDNDKPRELARNSMMGVVIKDPGPDASIEEEIEYRRYLMSGCVMSMVTRTTTTTVRRRNIELEKT
ncbi:hypothetical protein D9613_011879 [Agrocybe pediades]|uniref:Uncharacterized protein n=1 Tax=Agrocybe pediades TaxID=84607 RepID=A0A8H4VJ17_9AGAR|nr:hypothetical protein D9613_011879 [Agrocybe pediades]